ncbi:hypothetical protein [Nocardia rhizosphaerae]|uniref:Uncharacterized protein n=1 Tax=Nocardia rhizosphaerae TaxID=1691571 RepID=A0ABV8LBD5_9NOCA
MTRSSSLRRLVAVLGGAAALTAAVAGAAAADPARTADHGDHTLVLCGAPGEPAPPAGPRVRIEHAEPGDRAHFDRTRPVAPGEPAQFRPALPLPPGEPGECVRIGPDGERTTVPAPDGPIVIAPSRPR